MFDYPVVFVDIETTGGSYRNSRILEIAMIRYENGQITREYSTLLDPGTYVPSSITALTGITQQDIVGMPNFSDIASEVEDMISGAIFIAHNVRFDYSFIKHEFERLGSTFSPKLLCTVRLSRALYSLERGHSLAKLIERHDIPVSARHRALEDARAILLFTVLAFKEHGVELFNDAVARQLKTQSLPPHIDSEVVNGIDNVPGVYIFRDETKQPLYVGKSVSLRNRVMSHFQSTNSKEIKISQQVHHIETIKTGSELAALILESKLVKELQPIHNRLLRRVTLFAMLVKSETDSGFAAVSIQSGAIDNATDLAAIYGIYRNRTMAKKKLDEITRTFGLCPKLMGLENGTGACFSYTLGKCRGACIGKEDSERYNRRFELALTSTKVASWEYPAAVSIPVNELGERVVIDNWIVQGFLTPEGEMTISDIEPNFDVDEYKIIRRFIKQNKHMVQLFDQDT